ncbi:hypothetical protein ACOHYD_04465 [Desulfobacterota bacterium M19]
MPEKGQANFVDQIDDAIDELFTTKRVIEIDPLTNEVKELASPEGAAPHTAAEDQNADSSPPPDSPPRPSAAPAGKNSPPVPESGGKTAADKPGGNNQLNLLLNRLDQAFLALDWEISTSGTNNFLALLDDLHQLLNTADEELLRVIDLTRSLIRAIAEKPAQVPPRASGSLHKAIILFKEFNSPGQTPEIKIKTMGLIKELQAINEAISTEIIADTGQENQPPPDNDTFGPEIISADLPDGIPLEISNIVNLHLSILAQCINRLLPLEKLFGLNPRYTEYLDIHRQVRETLEEEKDRLSTALSTSYGPVQPGQVPEALSGALKSNIETIKQCLNKLRPVAELARRKKAVKLYRAEQEIGRQLDSQQKLLAMGLRHGFHQEVISPSPALTAAVRDHIEALGKCIKQILPLENLFAKTRGYDKLHAAQRRIRLYLEAQKKQLTARLQETGTTAADQQPTPAAASPWPVLFKASWQGITVLIPPDELAIETQGRPAKLPLDRPLAVKKLKRRPWSKLQPLFKGELAQTPEAALRRLELPWLTPLINAPDQVNRKNGSLIILYKNKQGGGAVIDEPGTEINIDDNWHWQEAGADEHFMFKGFLWRHDERLPVLSVSGKK